MSFAPQRRNWSWSGGVIGIFVDQPGCFRLTVTSISAASLVDKVIVACNIVMVMLINYYTVQKTILRRKR